MREEPIRTLQSLRIRLMPYVISGIVRGKEVKEYEENVICV